MNENKEFEHEIDPDLLAEIEEWERQITTSQRNITSPIQTRISNRSPYRPIIPGATATLTRTGISARKTCPLSGFPN